MQFDNTIKLLKKHRKLYGIDDFCGIKSFYNGYYSAYKIYMHNKDVLFEHFFEHFEKFVNEYFKSKVSENLLSWEYLIRSGSTNNDAAWFNFHYLLKLFFDKELKYSYVNEYTNLLLPARNFRDVIKSIIKNPSAFQIHNVNDFFYYYIGYSMMGDKVLQKSGLVFDEFDDETFIILNLEPFHFDKYICKCLGTEQLSFYKAIYTTTDIDSTWKVFSSMFIEYTQEYYKWVW